jgi:2-polyprenyl-3-methyl-5-hydroxy-6-metoxy-1,4-benzoquinol methylase
VKEIIARIASRYRGRWLQGYIRGKLGSDPVYVAGLDRLKDSPLPVLDVGCGVGLLACWLREHGCTMPIHGVDFDAGKIAAAQRATTGLRDVTFAVGDAAEVRAHRGHIVLFDVLHFLDAAAQRALLGTIAAALAPGACCLLRTTIRDRSWRFRITRLEDRCLHAMRWMRAGARHYATVEEVCAPFREHGCACEVRPLWAGTPFNSYLFVASPATSARLTEPPPGGIRCA